DGARLLFPAQDPVVGDVAPEEIPPVAEPDRPLGPPEAGAQPFDLRRVHAVLREARIEDLDGGIGIALARLPVRVHCPCRGHHRGRAARAEKGPPAHAPSSSIAWMRALM